MNQYIINGDEIYTLLKGKKSDGEVLAYWEKDEIIKNINSRPYNPQAEREKVLDELEEWIDKQVPKIHDLSHPFYECKTRTKGKIEELRKGESE